MWYMSNDANINVKLVHGTRVKIRNGKVVVFCYYAKHRGAITSLNEHNCLG